MKLASRPGRSTSGGPTWQELDADPRYDSALTLDYFYPIYGGDDGPCLESWVTLGAPAQATTRIRVGPMVNAARYRDPGLFAAMASTLDIAIQYP